MLSILIASVGVLIYIVFRKKYNYFSNRNLPFIKLTWVNFIESLSVTYMNEMPIKIYQQGLAGDSAYTGLFTIFLKPSVVILDPAMVQKVLIKDFSHFHDHGFEIDFDTNPLAGHLFNMKGDNWRTLRSVFYINFSSV